MKEDYDFKKVGSFEVISGAVVVTDPCYQEDEMSFNRVEIPNGTYDAYVEVVGNEITNGWGDRVANLLVLKSGIDPSSYEPNSIDIANFDVGVDSGQAGVFDSTKVHLTHEEDYDSWCKLSTNENSAGVMAYGAVSQSGYGDGGYACHLLKNAQGIVEGLVVVFIAPDDEEEDGIEEDFEEVGYDELTEED